MGQHIVLHCPRIFWFNGLVFIFMGLGLPLLGFIPASQPIPISLLLFLFVISQFHTVNGVSLIAAMFLHRIEANEHGINWRGRTGKRFTSWSEITDYYEKRPSRRTVSLQSNKKRPYSFSNELWVEAGKERFMVGPFLEGDLEAFRKQLRQKAVSASAEDWELFGTRPCDTWPRIFQYDLPRHRREAWISGSAAILYVFLANIGLWHLCRHYYASLGEGEVRSLYRMLWLIAIWPCVFLALQSFRNARALANGAAGVGVTPEGFEYRGKNGDIVTGEWNSVLDYYVVPTGSLWGHRSVVTLKGRDEKFWSFTSQIDAPYDLHYIIRKYAPSPALRPPDGALWPFKRNEHAVSSVGGRVYSYQSREMRCLLMLGNVFLLLLLGIALVDKLLGLHSRQNDDRTGFLALLLFVVIPLAYGWWHFYAGGIETDDFGITQRTLFGRRRHVWLGIREYKTKEGVYYVYGKDKKPIIFWSAISPIDDLKAEIQRRSPSPLTGWNTGRVDLSHGSER